MSVKESLHKQCLDRIEMRYQTVLKTIREIKISLHSETKSSAGDKHETGRAMLQLEREKAGQQLAEIEKVKIVLSKIDPNKISKKIHLGSVVYTLKGNYYLSISAGNLQFENTTFYAISPGTPIGKLIMGKTIGDTILFRDEAFKIENVI